MVVLLNGMFIDVVLPNKNESEFVSQAKKLGADGLIFLYKKDDKNNFDFVKKFSDEKFFVFSGLIVKDKFLKKYDYLFSLGSRKNFENKKLDFVFEIEKNNCRDHTHYRNSGLNQVLCKLSKDKNITIFFSFNSLLNAKNNSLILGRMMQNAKLCKKYSVNVKIASFARKPSELRYWKDLISFGKVIGLDAGQAKKAVLNRKV
jgi:hypothetical protein|tara:strand:+ start:174 stop:782 length:609 start_codon:yes stop_codon:yes gene_type:complete